LKYFDFATNTTKDIAIGYNKGVLTCDSRYVVLVAKSSGHNPILTINELQVDEGTVKAIHSWGIIPTRSMGWDGNEYTRTRTVSDMEDFVWTETHLFWLKKQIGPPSIFKFDLNTWEFEEKTITVRHTWLRPCSGLKMFNDLLYCEASATLNQNLEIVDSFVWESPDHKGSPHNLVDFYIYDDQVIQLFATERGGGQNPFIRIGKEPEIWTDLQDPKVWESDSIIRLGTTMKVLGVFMDENRVYVFGDNIQIFNRKNFDDPEATLSQEKEATYRKRMWPVAFYNDRIIMATRTTEGGFLQSEGFGFTTNWPLPENGRRY